MFCVAEKDMDKCKQYGIRDEIVACSSIHVGYIGECVGCGARHLACPNEAIRMKERPKGKEISIRVNGEHLSVPERITVKGALELLGYRISRFPSEGVLFAPCEVGGCYSCVVEVDGEVKPSCVNGVKQGIEVNKNQSGQHR